MGCGCGGNTYNPPAQNNGGAQAPLSSDGVEDRPTGYVLNPNRRTQQTNPPSEEQPKPPVETSS